MVLMILLLLLILFTTTTIIIMLYITIPKNKYYYAGHIRNVLFVNSHMDSLYYRTYIFRGKILLIIV